MFIRKVKKQEEEEFVRERRGEARSKGEEEKELVFRVSTQ